MNCFVKYTRLALPVLTALTVISLSACNEKSDDTSTYAPSSSVAVSSFRFRPDTEVMSDLDSVFFSIDLQHGVIFNADSLPVGTNVQRLIPIIVYPSGVTSATIQTSGGEYEETIDYKKTPTAEVDFSGDAYLTLVAEDGVTTATYRLKVNVHKQDPDEMLWDDMAIASIPSRFASPAAQGSAILGTTAYCLTEESDGSMTLAKSDDLLNGQWDKTALTLPFTPDLSTLTASARELAILDRGGNLHVSTDGSSWTATGCRWLSLTGGYGDYLLGIAENGNGFVHTAWPAGTFEESALEQDFPVKGSSDMALFDNKWAAHPTGVIVGGVTADGAYSSATWAFDGLRWAKISNGAIPAVTGASLVPYYSYIQTSALWMQTEYSCWLLTGGLKEDGTVNRDIYISYDCGINWRKGSDNIQFPDAMPDIYGSDLVVMNTDMSSSLEDSWKKIAPRKAPLRRIKYELDGTTISWECPYIYLFGGYTADGRFYPYIRRGVLRRLTGTPII